VKFNQDLETAMRTNVDAVSHLLNLCNQFAKLDVVVHVSTAYVHAPGDASRTSNPIQEELRALDFDHRVLREHVRGLSPDELLAQTPGILSRNGNWPNTYCLTKCIGEHIIAEHVRRNPLRCVILRPTIITCAASTPTPVRRAPPAPAHLPTLPAFTAATRRDSAALSRALSQGWMDSVLGPSGLVMAVALGALHVAPGDPDLIVDFIPVDFVVNAALASSWFCGRGVHLPPSAPDVGAAAGAVVRGVNAQGWMSAGRGACAAGGGGGESGGRALDCARWHLER